MLLNVVTFDNTTSQQLYGSAIIIYACNSSYAINYFNSSIYDYESRYLIENKLVYILSNVIMTKVDVPVAYIESTVFLL